MISSTRVGHALPNIDFVKPIAMSGDMPTDQIFFMTSTIFRNTTKPTVLNWSGGLTRLVYWTCRGGLWRRTDRERPSMLEIVTPVSPLKIAVMNEDIIDRSRRASDPLFARSYDGATGPATIAGTLALTTAEVLFGVVLTQLIKPGAKLS